MPSLKEIANELVTLCKEGRNADAIDKLYSKDVVSVEAKENEGMPRQMNGIDAVSRPGQK